MEAKGRYKEGYHVADYYSFKVTCEECRDLGDIGAKLACRARIAGSLGTPIASRFASGGMEAGVGVVVGTTGAAILFSVGASQAWNPVGWAALGVGGIIAVKGAWDIGQAFRIKAAVNGAIDTYCDCSDLR